MTNDLAVPAGLRILARLAAAGPSAQTRRDRTQVMGALVQPDRTPAIEAVGLTKRYGRVTAVSGLDLRVEPGTVLGFLGPNGSGKTTTLRMLGGLIRPTAGTIRLAGRDPWDPAARMALGYMPADPVFLPHLTGRENLDALAGLRPDRRTPDRAAAALALGLEDADLDRTVGTYSSGMKQKLAIVAALQHHPDVVVLDEPANRLDPIAHRAFCELVRGVVADRRTVLLSSHVLAEVEAVCDLVVLLRRGSLLRVATVAELQRQASRRVTLTFADGAPVFAPAEVGEPVVRGSVVTGWLPARRPDLVRTLAGLPGLADLTLEPAPLEQVFVDLYSGGTS